MNILEQLFEQATQAVAQYAGHGLDPDLAMGGLRKKLVLASQAKATGIKAFTRPQTPTICYVANAPYFNLFRESLIIRGKLGWCTILLNLTGINNRFQTAFFDRAQGFNGDLEALLQAIDQLNPDIVQVLGWHHAHYLPMLLRLHFPDRPVLCEFQDLVSAFLNKDDFVRLWGQTPAEAELEHVAERFIVENADGLLFPYAPAAAGFLSSRYALACSTLSLPAYPFPEFFAPPRSDMDKNRPRNRLLFVGGIPATNYPDTVFGDAKLLNLLPSILAQDVQFTVFNNPVLPTDLAVYYPEHAELSRQHNNYRFIPGVSPDRLGNYAKHYDYGVMLYLFDGVHVRPDHLHHVLPSKFYAYMEMGLPVLVSPKLTAVAKQVDTHGIGLVIGAQDMARLGDILTHTDWQIMHRNVLAYRKNNSINAHADALADFLHPFVPATSKVIRA